MPLHPSVTYERRKQLTSFGHVFSHKEEKIVKLSEFAIQQLKRLNDKLILLPFDKLEAWRSDAWAHDWKDSHGGTSLQKLVEDDLVVLADDGEVDIRSTITFNQAIGENESNIQTIPFVSGFDETTRIIFFEYTQFNRFSNPLVIDRIEIVYAILDLGLVSTLVLDQTVMSVIDASAYRPSQSYSDTFLTNESIYYDGIWLTRFNAFNVYDLYYLGGVFLFLLLIGYVSFIYPRRKQKKSLNSNIERTRKVL
jgi:hypothetical protein